MGVFTFEPIFETDLRSSRGGQLKFLKAVNIVGDYTTGGVPITPDDVGLNTIYMLGMQGSYAVPSDVEDPDNSTWMNIHITTMRFYYDETVEWKMLAFMVTEGEEIEIPDGSPMIFDERIAPTAMVIGS